jgi:hypothetical protein
MKVGRKEARKEGSKEVRAAGGIESAVISLIVWIILPALPLAVGSANRHTFSVRNKILNR